MISSTTAIPADEFQLASLASAKFAGMIQGTFSVGLYCLDGDFIDARTFFDTQFEILSAFATVLHTVSGGMTGQETILRLRGFSSAILSHLDELRRLTGEHIDSGERDPLVFRAMRDSASALCDALADFGDLLGLDRSRVAKVKAVILAVFAGVGDASRVAEAVPR